MPKKAERPESDERLKGKVAVDGVLRFLTELRQGKKEPTEDTEKSTQTKA